MQAVASNVHAGLQFKGIAFDQERAQIVQQLPCGGLDIQDEPVYWVFPDGQCRCWSVRDLAEAREDQLVNADEDFLEQAYTSVGVSLDIIPWASHHINMWRSFVMILARSKTEIGSDILGPNQWTRRRLAGGLRMLRMTRRSQ